MNFFHPAPRLVANVERLIFQGLVDAMEDSKALPPRTLEVLSRLDSGYTPTVPEELVLHCMRCAGDDTSDVTL